MWLIWKTLTLVRDEIRVTHCSHNTKVESHEKIASRFLAGGIAAYAPRIGYAPG
jgi:hypothetical protein